MESLSSYLTVDGWRRDWKQTKEDFRYSFKAKSTDRVNDLMESKGDYGKGRSISEKICGGVEAFWGHKISNYLPHYRFFFVPIYKSLGGKKRPIFATMSTFAVSSIVHDWDLIPNLVNTELDLSNYCKLILLLGSGALISYVKAKRKRKQDKGNSSELNLEQKLEPIGNHCVTAPAQTPLAL